MGRKKNFSRESVLDKAIPVFWRRGFADTSLQDLELATGVNKSGLYAEFKDKEDLYIASLRRYLDGRLQQDWLTALPLGWRNVERFLKGAHGCADGQGGCFANNATRDLALLPFSATQVLAEAQQQLKQRLAANIAAESERFDADGLAELVLLFFYGVCTAQTLAASNDASDGRIDHFMRLLKSGA